MLQLRSWGRQSRRCRSKRSSGRDGIMKWPIAVRVQGLQRVARADLARTLLLLVRTDGRLDLNLRIGLLP